MPLTPQRRERLLTLLSQEQSKTGKYSPTPAVFRETALDTHKAVPAEYWGAPAGATPPRRTSAPMQHRPTAGGGWQRSTGTLRRSASYVQRSTGAAGEPDYSDFRSVFKPTREQEPVCQRATHHRGNVAASEWALLDTWQAQMFDDERRHKYQVLAGRQVDQRAALEKQLWEQEQQKRAEQAEKLKDAQALAQQVAEAKAIEQRKAEEAKASLVKIKREMDNMLTTTRAQKQAAAVARQQQELAELAAVQAALDADKVAAAAKMVNMKQQWQQTLAANEARIAARREAEAKQREKDNELLQETMRTLDAQEKAREEAQHAFHAMVAAKASRVGKVALDARREKEEKEELRIKQMHDILEADAKQREAAAASKKQAQKELMRKERADYLARQAEKLRAQQEDLARQRADAEERARLEREYEDHKMAMIRQRARSNADFVRTQALDREDRQVADDVFMTDAERQLNARLLEQATLRVGRPRQLTVKLC